MSLDATYTVADVAANLRCSEWYVRECVKKGLVQPIRIGQHRRASMRFSVADVEALEQILRPPASVRARPHRRRGT